jgi:hypothetical protein
MVKLTRFRPERLPAASVATKPARNCPGVNDFLPILPPNRLAFLPATPGWVKLPTLR